MIQPPVLGDSLHFHPVVARLLLIILMVPVHTFVVFPSSLLQYALCAKFNNF